MDEWEIQFDTGYSDPDHKWRLAKRTSERYWKRDLGYLKKFVPQDTYRVIVTIRKVIVID